MMTCSLASQLPGALGLRVKVVATSALFPVVGGVRNLMHVELFMRRGKLAKPTVRLYEYEQAQSSGEQAHALALVLLS
jgi:hypothetical protein